MNTYNLYVCFTLMSQAVCAVTTQNISLIELWFDLSTLAYIVVAEVKFICLTCMNYFRALISGL